MESREKSLTSATTATELVALSLFLLGGDGRPIDTEDVAKRVHAIAPGRFAWRKYPDQINLELVRVALSDARKPESGALVSGTGKSGWTLTPAGRRWADGRAGDLLGRDLTKQRAERTAGSIDERRWQRERARLLTTEAWARWSESRDASAITEEDAADLFRIDRYVVGRARGLKINRLVNMFGEDADLLAFLETAASRIGGSRTGE
jgi:hypothetical protein